MSTSFEIIFQRFLNKVTDSDLASLLPDTLDSILTDYLRSSITRFRKCQKDLNDFDLDLQQFNVDLNLDEIEILANWMKYEWLEQQINRIELLRQSLSSKDYAMYSQANHLDKMLLLKQQIYTETNQMITDYTYNFGKLDDLR
jgi:hypothetical protein